MCPPLHFRNTVLSLVMMSLIVAACQPKTATNADKAATVDSAAQKLTPISAPLISNQYTADPSAHVFEGKLFIYPSHDIDAGIPENDKGDHFDMRDYHVLSMDSINGPVMDHGVALDIRSIPWVGRQLWAPDAAFANGRYYLFFPAKDKKDIFRIGVATGTSPRGPFTAEKNPIPGSFSIDPAVFKETDGTFYMYFGGIWGGQLQRWRTGSYDSAGKEPADDRQALSPKVVRLSKDLLKFDEPVRDVMLLDEAGKPLLTGDHNRRFFEASWIHQYNGKYYFSYSTGDTHFICYAVGDRPYGPFTYKGVILNPVIGWTNHHSIVLYHGHWYLFYHDSTLSGGKTHLRSIKVTELFHQPDGSIRTIDAYVKK